jgi:hypothetical protein
MTALMQDPPPIDDQTLDLILGVTTAPIVVVEPRKIKPSHLKPQKQGTGASSTLPEDLNVILAKRTAGVNLRRIPTISETALAESSDETLLQWMTRKERHEEFKSLGFTSATGLPRFMKLNDVMLEYPLSFSYTVERDHVDVIPTEFSYRVNSYPNFRVVSIGERVLDLARRERAIIAFGFARASDELHFFYMAKGEGVEMLTLTDDGRAYHVRNLGNRKVLCVVKADRTAVNATRHLPADYNLPQYVAILAGDPVAMLNYGNYLNTRSRNAMSMMGAILGRLGTGRPRSISNFLPSYPDFPEDAIPIPRARSNILVGYRSARKFKLVVPVGEISACQRIDLNGDVPQVMYEPEADEFDDDDWS